MREIDRENLKLAPEHLVALDRVNRGLMVVYGLGGLSTALGCVAAPVLVTHVVDLSALQVVLVSAATLIGGLSLVRTLARASATVAKRRLERHCVRHAIAYGDLTDALALMRHHWFFAAALLVDEPTPKP